MKTYSFDILDNADLDRLSLTIEKITKLFASKDFKEFLKEKCQKVLNDICDMSFPLPNEYGNDVNEYLAYMKAEIEDDYIILYNDSEIDVSKKNMSQTTKEKYPNKLSLAQIIEYGIGIEGANSPYSFAADDWQFDVNNHGEQGWYYYDDAGNLYWTSGFEGRYIFYKLSQYVELYIDDWIEEYIETNLD